MQASSVSIGPFQNSKPGRSVSALIALALAGATLVGVAPQVRADDGRIVVSTGLGAIAGALIGQSMGGRNATIVGGAIGAAIGASAATQGGTYRESYHRAAYEAPAVYAPPPGTYRPAVQQVVYPVAYYGPARGYGVQHSRPQLNQYDSDERHSRSDRADRYERNEPGRRYDRGGWDSDRGSNFYHR